MLGDKRGKRIDEYTPDYVVFDLETTGMSLENDAVVEISALKVIGGKVVDEFSTLVNPGRSIPFYATKVNGITDEMVADAPGFEQVLESFFEFAGDLVLVGHNIHGFDMGYIYRDSFEYFGQVPDNDYIDTLYVAKKVFPKIKHRALTALADGYGISIEGAHRALKDCYMNQQVYEHMINGDEMVNYRVCPLCNNTLKRRKGKFGEFYGCMGYPNCKYTENIRY